MKKVIPLLIAALFILLTIPCAFAQPDTLTILFTTDIHSNMTPHQALIDGQTARVGGFARLASAIKANYSDGETLIMDSGDFSMGTLYQSFTGTDALELTLMDALGYDAVALGNHDFELTVDGLRDELNTFYGNGGQTSILCSNLTATNGNKALSDANANPLADVGVKNYTIIERNGLRIGAFALMGNEAIQYTPADPLSFADPIETAKACVKTLREYEQVDMVVLLSHCGMTPNGSFDEDAEIARAVDGIDVILSGHMHASFDKPMMVNDTAIVCAGTGLSYLGRLQLRRSGKKWSVTDYALIPLTDAWPDDPDVAAIIAPYTARLEDEYMACFGVTRPLDDVIATSPYDFSNDELYTTCAPHAFGAMMCDAYLASLRALGINDVCIACIPTGTVRSGLYRGDLTLMDAYNVLSYGISPLDGSPGAPIVTACFTGSELYDMCETSISLSGSIDSVQMLLSGVRYTYSLRRPILDRVYKVEVINPATGEYEAVERSSNKLYKAAFSWTSAQSLELIGNNSHGLLDIRLKDESGAPIDTTEKLLERIVYMPLDNGQSCELKEWYALYKYIEGFPKNADGLPEVPEKYGRPADYMAEVYAGPLTLITNHSKTGWLILAASAAVLLLVVLATTLIMRKRRKHTNAPNTSPSSAKARR